jgi:hypothetical protein
MDNETLSLKNTDSYLNTFQYSLKDVFSTIKLISYHYVKCCSEITVEIELSYLEKGLAIVLNVFKVILLYTKNLEVAKGYTLNSIYYFIEYLQQINNKETEVVFVSLTLNDAILYVYRKSIYEISDAHKKKFKLNETEKMKLNVIKDVITLYQSLLVNVISSGNMKVDMDTTCVVMNKVDSFFESVLLKNSKNYLCKNLNIIIKNYSNIFDTTSNINVIDTIDKMNNLLSSN